jgi:hypothetical protein
MAGPNMRVRGVGAAENKYKKKQTPKNKKLSGKQEPQFV